MTTPSLPTRFATGGVINSPRGPYGDSIPVVLSLGHVEIAVDPDKIKDPAAFVEHRLMLKRINRSHAADAVNAACRTAI